MRQTERKQLGLAVAALMLCFTSLVPLTGKKGADATVAESRPTQTLSEVCHVDATDDRVMQVFDFASQNQPPLMVVRRNDDPQFMDWVNDINTALLADSKANPPGLALVLYERNGQPDCRLTVTTDGNLYDPKTKLRFQTNSQFHQFIQTLLKQRAQAN